MCLVLLCVVIILVGVVLNAKVCLAPDPVLLLLQHTALIFFSPWATHILLFFLSLLYNFLHLPSYRTYIKPLTFKYTHVWLTTFYIYLS